MGRRGPAQKPTNLRLLHGDRADRINDAEPEPRDLPAQMPDWLTPDAQAEWLRVAPDLEAMGTVKEVDATALAAYCEAVSRFRAAVRMIGQAGLLLRDDQGGVRKNPAVAMARDASTEMRVWCREFGLTPSARAGIRVDVHHHGAGVGRLLTNG